MKKFILCLLVFLFAGSITNAQDPGEQDSIIINTLAIDSPGEAYVWIWVRTDDSVAYYNIPLQFTASGTGITFNRIDYFPPLTNWDETYFEYNEDDEFLINYGFMDIYPGWNPRLHTNYERLHTFNIVFDIDFNATMPQVVDIDFYDDPVNGPTILGLISGPIQVDPALVPGAIHYGVVGIEEEGLIPTVSGLAQNYPNPFNPSTNIDFSLPSEQHVRIDVYNILGQHIQTIADGFYPTGNHTASWYGANSNGEQVPSGIYFYKMISDDFSQTNKMLLFR